MLSLEDLTGPAEASKATFTRLAEVPDTVRETLQDVSEDLAEAGDKVEAGRGKVQDVHAVALALKQA